MCGRYGRKEGTTKQALAEALRVKDIPAFAVAPDYNIAPQTFQPVVRLNRDTGDREMVLMQWDMTSHFTKPEDFKKARKPINARSDNLKSGLWKTPFQRFHVMVPFDFFVEWPDKDSVAPGADRIPQVYEIEGNAMPCFAGIYDCWHAPGGDVLESYAFITAEHNELLAALSHPRSPVVLNTASKQKQWLEFDPEQPPLHLLVPPDGDRMKTWRVNPKINNSGKSALQGAELIEPMREEMVQQGLFG